MSQVESLADGAVQQVTTTGVSLLKSVVSIIPVVGGILSTLLSVVKPIIEFIWGWFKSTLQFIAVSFQAIFGIFVYATKPFVRDITNQTFGNVDNTGNPMLKSAFEKTLVYVSVFGDELRSVASNLVVTLTPVLAAFAFGFIISIIGIVFVYFVGLFAPAIIGLINEAFILLNVALQLLTVLFNSTSNLLNIAAPFWNTYMEYWGFIIKEVFKTLCNTSLVFTGNLFTDCPIINSILESLVQTINFYISAIELTITTAKTIYAQFEYFECPGGPCNIDICSLVGQAAGCSFDFSIFTSSIAEAVEIAIVQFLPLFKSVLFFLLDVLTIVIREYQVLLVIAQSGLGSLSNVILGKATSTVYEPFLDDLPNDSFVVIILRGIAQLLVDIITWFLGAALDIIIAADALVCNIFIDFLNCGAAKICNALFQSFIICSAAPFDFLCINVNLAGLCLQFGLNVLNCANSCDRCKYLPPLPAILSFFGLLDAEGKLDVPCNLKDAACAATGCMSSYSIAKELIAI